MKFSGSTMIYSLMIGLIISTFLGAYILVNHYQHQFLFRLQAKELAPENLKSGVLIYLNQGVNTNEFYQSSLYDSDIDSVYLRTESWGVLGLIHGRGVHSHNRYQRSCLVGGQALSNQTFTLYLTDERQPLVLVGQSKLIGKLYLPPSGIKAGHIGAISFQGNSLYTGTVFPSGRSIRPMQTNHLAMIKAGLYRVMGMQSSGETFLLENVEIKRNWDEETYEIVTPHSLILSNTDMRGRCMIVSAGEVIVSSSVYLEHTLIFAKKVIVSSSFKGSIQAFATEGIEVKAGARLIYPSTIGVFKTDKEIPITLLIENGAEIEGSVMADIDLFHHEKDREDYVLLEEGVQIWGDVWVRHNLDLRGSVKGRVITDNFIARTPAASYRNHLLGGEINLSQRAKDYLGPLVFESSRYGVIEWLDSYPKEEIEEE